MDVGEADEFSPNEKTTRKRNLEADIVHVPAASLYLGRLRFSGWFCNITSVDQYISTGEWRVSDT